MEWVSPDDKIFKKTLKSAQYSHKPYEGSMVMLNILDCPSELAKYNNITFTIGDSDGDLGRMLDICVCTMHLKEQAEFTISLELKQIYFIVELVQFEFKGFIYEWDTKQKYEIALMHKEKGVQMFNQKNQIDAAYRFTKAIKIISSIPIDVEEPPKSLDGVKLSDINVLKEKLLNNLSSCYFREGVYDMVIPLCNKSLAIDSNNVKALYKAGVAYEEDKNFEKANEVFSKALVLEPQNKACAEHLANVEANLIKANTRVNHMMKKMISGVISK